MNSGLLPMRTERSARRNCSGSRDGRAEPRETSLPLALSSVQSCHQPGKAPEHTGTTWLRQGGTSAPEGLQSQTLLRAGLLSVVQEVAQGCVSFELFQESALHSTLGTCPSVLHSHLSTFPFYLLGPFPNATYPVISCPVAVFP